MYSLDRILSTSFLGSAGSPCPSTMLPPSHAGGGLGMMPNPELLAGLVDETTCDILEEVPH